MPGHCTGGVVAGRRPMFFFVDLVKKQVMNLVDKLFTEHAALLNSRHYDENSIGSLHRQGQLLEDLKRNIGLCVHKSGEDEVPIGFSLQTVGAFAGHADMVKFDFHYVYFPKEEELKLNQLDLRWGQHSFSMKLNTSYHLPVAKAAFDRLERETRPAIRQGKPVKIVVPRATKPRRRL